MDVLEREDRRPLGCEFRQPGDDRVVQAAAELLGFEELQILIPSRQPEQTRDVWPRRTRESILQLARDLVVGLVTGKPDEAAKQVSIRPVGERGTVREAACLEPPDAVQLRAGLRLLG